MTMTRKRDARIEQSARQKLKQFVAAEVLECIDIHGTVERLSRNLFLKAVGRRGNHVIEGPPVHFQGEQPTDRQVGEAARRLAALLQGRLRPVHLKFIAYR